MLCTWLSHCFPCSKWLLRLTHWLHLTIVISLNVQALWLVGWCIWRFNVSSTAPGKYPTCPRVKCGPPKFSIHKIYGNQCGWFQKCWAKAFGGCFMAQEVPTWRNIRRWCISQKKWKQHRMYCMNKSLESNRSTGKTLTYRPVVFMKITILSP